MDGRRESRLPPKGDEVYELSIALRLVQRRPHSTSRNNQIRRDRFEQHTATKQRHYQNRGKNQEWWRELLGETQSARTLDLR